MERLILRGRGCPADGSKFITLSLEDGRELVLHMHPAMFEVLARLMAAEHNEVQRIAHDVVARRN